VSVGVRVSVGVSAGSAAFAVGATRFTDAVTAFTEALKLDPSIRPATPIIVRGIITAFAAAQRALASQDAGAG